MTNSKNAFNVTNTKRYSNSVNRSSYAVLPTILLLTLIFSGIAYAGSISITNTGQTQTLAVNTATNLSISGNNDNITISVSNDALLQLSISGNGSKVLVENGNVNLTISGSNDSIILQNSVIGDQLITGSSNKITCVPSCGLGGHTVLSEFTIAVNTNSPVTANVHYPCSTQSSQVAPYVSNNGTWTPISPYTTNSTSCTVSFAIPKIMTTNSSKLSTQEVSKIAIIKSQLNQTKTVYTTVTTTAVSTVYSNQTTIQQASANSSNLALYAIIIIIVVIVAAYAIFKIFVK